jgi:hypothetical protein
MLQRVRNALRTYLEVPAHKETPPGTCIAQHMHRKLWKSARMSKRLARLVRENQSVYNKEL